MRHIYLGSVAFFAAESVPGLVRAVRVPRRNAEALRRALERAGALDRTRASRPEDGTVVFPVSEAPPLDLETFEATVVDVPETPRRSTETPRDRILARVSSAARPFVPRRWDRLGDVVVLRFPESTDAPLREIARAFAEVLEAKAVVRERAIAGPWRTPEVDVLWGTDTRTVRVEGGIAFALDPAKVMLSSGNLPERLGIADRVADGEVVVDLFAGIGYFSIPIAVRANPSRVVACEANPEAFRFLEENVRRNRAWCVEPRLGDCREVAPEGVADRVVVGYLRSGPFLGTAMRTIAPSGGEVHVHAAVPTADASTPIRDVTEAAVRAGRTVLAASSRRVKSVAPHLVHVAVDARIGPKRVSIGAA